jgi:hypothetical protein
MTRSGDAPRRRRSDALATFRAYLAQIEEALLRRDAMTITALLRKRTAMHMPREVREELLALSRAPRDSLRAPVQFLRFQHRMAQLAAGGEQLPRAQFDLRLAPHAAGDAIRRREPNDRKSAARDGTEES